MRISKYNSEGYFDPTTYEALTRIEKEERAVKAAKTGYRPIVYICSPFAGDIDGNTKKARQYCRFAVEQNAIPLALHLLFPQFLDDSISAERELAMQMNLVLLGKCSELWVFGSTVSRGLAVEIERARQRNQRIRYFNETLEEVDAL